MRQPASQSESSFYSPQLAGICRATGVVDAGHKAGLYLIFRQ
jgi:hypothetical protein